MADEEEKPVDRCARLLLEEWSALGLKEREGELYLPTVIRRRKADGTLEEIPITLKRLDNAQRYQARKRSRKRAEELGLDLQLDKDLVSELESIEELAFAMRDPNPPYDQFRMSAKQLFEEFKAQELTTVYGELDAFTQRCDPRIHELTHEQQWKVIEEVAARGDLSPLVLCAGHVQLSCIVFSAKAAMLSPIAPSRSRWLSTSGPASSTPDGSSSSSAAS